MCNERYVFALKNCLMDLMGDLYKITDEETRENARTELVQMYELVTMLECMPYMVVESFFDHVVSKYEKLIK